MLLEAQIISKMALLFGTTWLVNSIVIGGLLTLIVAANCLVQWLPKIPVVIGYVGTLFTIAAGYFIPLDRLFFHSFWIKALAATGILCIPVFCGNYLHPKLRRRGFPQRGAGLQPAGSADRRNAGIALDVDGPALPADHRRLALRCGVGGHGATAANGTLCSIQQNPAREPGRIRRSETP